MSAPWDDPRVRAGLTRQLVAWRRMLDRGQTRLGWKVGFGAPTSLSLMELTAPLPGYLTDATLLASGAGVDTSGWTRGLVEFEVAVYLGADLGEGAPDDQARAAVVAVGPAIELADVTLPVTAAGVEEILAGNIFHKGVILGEPDTGRAGLDISGMVARISVDGEEHAATADLEAITGGYPWIVATVANTLAANGEMLMAGDVIITGSVIPPVSLTPGSEYTFALDPFDPISVRVF